MNQVVGKASFLWITLDCLRHDVACRALSRGRTPCLEAALAGHGWEPRETPGTFTLAAHLAFFHGFLPTPPGPGPHPRLFAMRFEGSLTIVPQTYVFEEARSVPEGFVGLGYRTCCLGGVGFFNRLNPLGNVLPGYFEDSFWSPAMGVTSPRSTAVQVEAALAWLDRLAPGQPFLLFINVSATHSPHRGYLPGAVEDTPETQEAALAYVDSQLPPLFKALARRGPCFCLVMADHGEAFGEDGRWGHRIAHPTVTTVPYAHFYL